MGSLYNRSRGLRDTLAQKADHIIQWVSEEAAVEAEMPLEMAYVAARKLHRKQSCWTGSTFVMAVAGEIRC